MNRKPRILVVDDDPTYRFLITTRLTREGYQVLMASDGREVLSWLRSAEQRPDLILLDLLMPQVSGLEVLDHLRAAGHRVPVILASGAEWTIARQGAAQAMPNAFLAKPFSMQQLLTTIESLLETSLAQLVP